MLNIGNIESLVTIAALVFAYFFSVSISGYLQAAYAKKLGDTTAQDAGFLTLNPFAHTDPLGLVWLVLLRFGWGRFVPFDPTRIYGKRRNFKIFSLFAAESVIAIGISLCALIVLILLLGPKPLILLERYIILFNYLGEPINYLGEPMLKTPIGKLLAEFPNTSSFTLVTALLLAAIVYFNTFIAAFSMILNGFRYMVTVGLEKSYRYMAYADYLVFLMPMVTIFFFAGPLRALILFFIKLCAFLLAYLLGAI